MAGWASAALRGLAVFSLAQVLFFLAFAPDLSTSTTHLPRGMEAGAAPEPGTGKRGALYVVLDIYKEPSPCQLAKVKRAQRELQAPIVCFWSQLDAKPPDAAVEEACPLLIHFGRDVAPHVQDSLRAFERGAGPDWGWWYGSFTFVLSYGLLKDRIFANASQVWWMEWDTYWAGDLSQLIAGVNRRGSENPSYGMGLPSHGIHRRDLYPMFRYTLGWASNWGPDRLCHRCSQSGNHFRVCGEARKRMTWSTYLQSLVYADREFCAGLLAVAWFSPRLLDLLYERLRAPSAENPLMYSESYASTNCHDQPWCEIQDLNRLPEFSEANFGFRPLQNMTKVGREGYGFIHPVKSCT